LGLYTLSGLVIANMIGAGVFTTSGFAMGDLGNPYLVIFAWTIGGCLALCGALSYGALSRLIPESGGEYLFLSRSIHPMLGFIAGWVSLLAGFTGAIAYAATTFSVYLLPGQGQGLENLVASGVIIVSAMAHGLRIHHGVILQNLSVVLKLLLIVLFISYALLTATADSWQGIPAEAQMDIGGFSIFTFAMTLMWISFSYAGFNAAIYIASEAHQPRRNVPRALVMGTLATLFLYIILNAIFVLAPAPELIGYKQDIAAIAAQAIGGDRLSGFVRIIICIALFTSVSSMVMLGPRVYAKMAEDGLMPEVMKFNGDVPSMAILMQALLAIMVVWISTLRELLSYLGFTLALSTVMTVSSLFILVRRDPVQKSHLPGYPWAPSLFIIFTLLFASLAARRQPWEMVAAVVTILSGVLAYYWFSRTKNTC